MFTIVFSIFIYIKYLNTLTQQSESKEFCSFYRLQRRALLQIADATIVLPSSENCLAGVRVVLRPSEPGEGQYQVRAAAVARSSALDDRFAADQTFIGCCDCSSEVPWAWSPCSEFSSTWNGCCNAGVVCCVSSPHRVWFHLTLSSCNMPPGVAAVVVDRGVPI